MTSMREPVKIIIRTWAILAAFLLGHIVTGEHSPIRLFFMRVFARYLEVPLLYVSYHACVGRLKFISRFRLTRALILYPVAYPFGHYGDTGKPIPADKLIEMMEGLEGKMAVGPCRCRVGHRACGHPMETDIVMRTGTDVWLKAFPDDYRVIEKDEAIRIVRECAGLGMFHMVFLHCLVGGAVNEYVICNCCTDGCTPYILNRTLGQKVFPLVKGEWRVEFEEDRCIGCGVCVAFCPFDARRLVNGKAEVLDCFGCGLCETHCPTGVCVIVSPPSPPLGRR
ncbi:MAG: 4Fe-4S dicluster domain-containing protein [Actinobacteria bacterium]|nr:4Fe-4S dicluster domain-containing protein [Actinomycetota bacterium]